MDKSSVFESGGSMYLSRMLWTILEVRPTTSLLPGQSSISIWREVSHLPGLPQAHAESEWVGYVHVAEDLKI